eukprot:366555-Chlamydomonas_euryale.AAC.3
MGMYGILCLPRGANAKISFQAVMVPIPYFQAHSVIWCGDANPHRPTSAFAAPDESPICSGGSPELPEGPPGSDVVAEASPRGAPPAQRAEVLDVITTAAFDRGQKHARSPQPGTILLTRYFPVTSKLSTALEGATRPGARVVAGRERVAGTAAVARNTATQRSRAARGSSDNIDEWSACDPDSRISSGRWLCGFA